MKIHRQDWERVLDKACDIANATEAENDPMYEVHLEGMMTLLDELESRYGIQSRILATRADYLENASDRRALYEQALDLAVRNGDTEEIEEIQDSLEQLAQEELPNKPGHRTPDPR
jgi:hypothetical protein